MSTVLALAVSLLTAAAADRPFDREADGVLVHAKGAQVRLRVCSERIVRVTALGPRSSSSRITPWVSPYPWSTTLVTSSTMQRSRA